MKIVLHFKDLSVNDDVYLPMDCYRIPEKGDFISIKTHLSRFSPDESVRRNYNIIVDRVDWTFNYSDTDFRSKDTFTKPVGQAIPDVIVRCTMIDD